MSLFRRDAQILPAPGSIVAEFSNGQQALRFARENGYTVTAGINYPFAVRIPCEEPTESVAASPSGPDSRPPAPTPSETGGGFQLRARTAYGQLALDALLARLPRTGDV